MVLNDIIFNIVPLKQTDRLQLEKATTNTLMHRMYNRFRNMINRFRVELF